MENLNKKIGNEIAGGLSKLSLMQHLNLEWELSSMLIDKLNGVNVAFNMQLRSQLKTQMEHGKFKG
jgi:hypothetical protein